MSHKHGRTTLRPHRTFRQKTEAQDATRLAGHEAVKALGQRIAIADPPRDRDPKPEIGTFIANEVRGRRIVPRSMTAETQARRRGRRA